MGPAGSENLARQDGEENDHSTFREPESDSSVLKTVMYSIYAVHSQGQIGSLTTAHRAYACHNEFD